MATSTIKAIPARAEMDELNKRITRVVLTSASPAHVQAPYQTSYATFIISGFAQGIGGVLIGITVNGGAIASIRNLMTGADFSNQALTFSYTSGVLTISSTIANTSALTIVRG